MLASVKEDEALRSKKIYLTYLNGTGFVFNVDDYMTIRANYRIIGSCVGTSHVKGYNPNSNGLPVELNEYETRILIEKGYAVLLQKDSLINKSTTEEQAAFKEFIEKRLEDQSHAFKAEKLKESQKLVQKIIHGKRNKLIRKGVKEKDINITEEDVLKEIDESTVFEKSNALLDIPYEHPFAHEAKIVSLPQPVNTSLKYRVFRDLWEKGKFVTAGESFGADFLIYPGDPLLFHASHIVVVLDNSFILPHNFIAKVRLSVIVNKICLFAYLCNDEISYQTVQWEKCNDGLK